MWKKRHIDFVLKESNNEEDFNRLIFRFYPRTSSCHSFNDNPPKTWKEVYKVYYHWAILSQYKESNKDCWQTKIVYEEHCDECSILDEIAIICEKLYNGIYIEKNIVDNEEYIYEYLNKELLPFGMATSWQIQKRESLKDLDDESKGVDIFFTFMLFDWFNNGYKFTLHRDDLLNFSNYLKNCCEYMLEHGDPI